VETGSRRISALDDGLGGEAKILVENAVKLKYRRSATLRGRVFYLVEI